VITIAELGEFGLIAAVAAELRPGPGLVVGVGDDAAVLHAPDGRVVATTDLLIEGRHFRRDWSRAADIGHRAAARNLVDVAAMGAVPTALLVGFAGPGDTAVDWVLELVRGITREASTVGASVAGGDTSSADTVMLAVTALGNLAGLDPVTRGGARPGDVVAVAGTLGAAGAGLALLTAGAQVGTDPVLDEPTGADSALLASLGADSADTDSADTDSVADDALPELIVAYRRPHPPYDAGPQAAALGATSMIDISDGLIADLGHVADASGVQIGLWLGALAAEPVAPASALAAAASVLGERDWLRWVLVGGDDHALVATFGPGVALPDRWTVIGEVTRGRGVLVDGRPWSGPAGWDHFRS
jgi:thiamine-monophosphate kinase